MKTSKSRRCDPARPSRCYWLAIAIAAVVAGSPASADDLPTTISPLIVEPDLNRVNLVTGKTAPDALVLSVPADPRLKFDRVQNAAPYVKSTVTKNWDTSEEMLAQTTVHTADGTSEAFECQYDLDAGGKVCSASLNGSGSMLNYGATDYRRGGSGERYSFDVLSQYSIPGAGDHDQKIHKLFYASRITYPDGEVIRYTYGSASISNYQYPYTVYRPTNIRSNRGFYITINYGCDDYSQTCWYQPTEAAIYNANDPATPLAKYTYNSDGTVTDLLSRVYTGYDPGLLGQKIEVANYSRTLPTENAPAIIVSAATGLPNGSPMVGSVNRDGVQWNYSYTNPVYYAGPDGYRYDSLSVTGPNGYHKTFTMAHTSSLSPNLISAVTDELKHETSYEYEATGGVNGSNVRVTKITFPERNYTSIQYDGAGNIVRKTSTAKPGSGLADLVEQAFVDLTPYSLPNGYLNCRQTVLCYRPTWYRDALNRQTDYVYNSRGQLTEQTDPAGVTGVRRKTYIEYEEVDTGYTHTENVNGQATTIHELNSRKKVVRVCGWHPTDSTRTTCGTNAESRTEYSYANNMTVLPAAVLQTDLATGATRATIYSYDNAGRPTMIDGPLSGTGDAKYFQYDTIGRKVWEIGELAPNGLRLAKKYTYRNSDDKVTSVQAGTVSCQTNCSNASLTIAVRQQTDSAYDDRRNPIRETTYNGATAYAVTDRSFLDRGLVDCTAVRMNFAALPAATATGACSLGTQGSQGPDRITKNNYDDAGHLLKVQKALQVTTAKGFPATLEQDYVSYSYTDNGKQHTVTDANGNLAEYTYDGFDRLIKWTFPDKTTAGSLNPGDYEQYAYDPVGNRTCLRKRDGSKFIYSFDDLNQMQSKVVVATSGGTCP